MGLSPESFVLNAARGERAAIRSPVSHYLEAGGKKPKVIRAIRSLLSLLQEAHQACCTDLMGALWREGSLAQAPSSTVMPLPPVSVSSLAHFPSQQLLEVAGLDLGP